MGKKRVSRILFTGEGEAVPAVGESAPRDDACSRGGGVETPPLTATAAGGKHPTGMLTYARENQMW